MARFNWRWRNLVSLGAGLSFLVLSCTGFLSFFLPYYRPLATIHTVFGLFFSACILLHIINNWRSLKSYFLQRA